MATPAQNDVHDPSRKSSGSICCDAQPLLGVLDAYPFISFPFSLGRGETTFQMKSGTA